MGPFREEEWWVLYVYMCMSVYLVGLMVVIPG